MKILYLLVITTIVFSGTSLAFAQEQTVKPPFEIYGGDSDVCQNTHVTINTPLDSNYTRSTVIDYGGTKLIATLSLGSVNYTTIKHDNQGAISSMAFYPMNTTFNKILPLKQITTSEFNSNIKLIIALTNNGSKPVTIVKPHYDLDMLVVNDKNGNSVYYPDGYFPHDFFGNPLHISDESIDLDTVFLNQLQPGESMLNYISPEKEVATSYYLEDSKQLTTYLAPISVGNYTITGVARFLSDVDGTCTLVYLWSQPVDLVTIPQILFVISGPNIHFSWVPPLSDGGSAITHYKVERSTDEKNWTTILLSPSQLYYNDHGVDPGTTYYYRMSAINAIGTSPPSEIISKTIPQSKGGGNSTLSAVSDTNFHLSWAAPLHTSGSAIAHYNIERSTDEKNWTVVSLPASQLYYDDHGLDPGTTYHYRISVINATNGIVYTSEIISKTALWSKPIQTNANETIPEFPFAISILLIGFASVIVFYRLKFVK